MAGIIVTGQAKARVHTSMLSARLVSSILGICYTLVIVPDKRNVISCEASTLLNISS